MTKYDRCEDGEAYYSYDNRLGKSCQFTESHFKFDDLFYKNASYCRDEKLSDYNGKSDCLLRQLRRYAVTHNAEVRLSDWEKDSIKYYIAFDYKRGVMYAEMCIQTRPTNVVCFSNFETCLSAMEEYANELLCYFREEY